MDPETLNAYGAGAEKFAEDWHAQPAPTDLHALVKRFFHPGGRTADVGCGGGREVAFLAASGYDAIGYDASDALLEQARLRYPRLSFATAVLPDLVGVPADPRFEGRSLKPYMKDAKADLSLPWFGETSYLFFRRKIPGEEPLYIPPMDETTTIDPEFDFHFVLKDKYLDDVLKTKERCLRTERFKLVYTPGKRGAIYRLYDTMEDQHCERDVKKQFPDVYAKMKSALAKWMDGHKESTVKEIFGGQDEFAIKAK